jgi:hypothetical protein
MAAGGGMEKWEEKVGASREEQRAASPLWSTCAYGVSSTGARREPGGGPVGNPKREGRRGQGLHVAGHGLQGPSECSLPRAVRSRDGARGPDSEAARPWPAQRFAERWFGCLDLQKVE